MRALLSRSFALIGVVTVLVLAANTVAVAANGKGFLLGRTNTASKVTTLERTKPGPALSLKTKDGPPLKVNSSTKVARLNADSVDGKSASDFAPAGLGDAVSGLDVDVAALRDRVDTADALTPIAAGFVYADGTLGANHGIGTVSYSSGAYYITIPGEDYYYTDYAPSVTPECAKASVNANSAGGRFYVAFSDTSTGATKPCAFAVTIVKLAN